MRRFLILFALLGCERSTGEAKEGSQAPGLRARPPLTARGCMRERETNVYPCSGVPPAEGEPNSYPAIACDRCLEDAHCTERRGGRCVEVGDDMCNAPPRLECRYPSAACGGKICPEPEPQYPPSAPPDPEFEPEPRSEDGDP
jgi:hypothetical protein